jgi:hypothetical protein
LTFKKYPTSKSRIRKKFKTGENEYWDSVQPFFNASLPLLEFHHEFFCPDAHPNNLLKPISEIH